MPRLECAPPPSAALLYLLHGDPAELHEALTGLRAADIAEALLDLSPDAGAKVVGALPFDLAVQVFDEPELEGHRCDIVRRMAREAAAPLIDAMSADQHADLFREMPESERPRFLKLLDPPRAGGADPAAAVSHGNGRRHHDHGVRGCPSGLDGLRSALGRWWRRRWATTLLGVVTFGSLAGSMLPFLLKRIGFDPASASAPFVATLVDVTGLIIYFSVALLLLRGTLL
jgi:Mg/Co/Ni transporter MgtE